MRRTSRLWTSLSLLLMIGMLPFQLAAQEADPDPVPDDPTLFGELPGEDDAPPPVPPPPPLPEEVPPPPEPGPTDPLGGTDPLGTDTLPGGVDGESGTVTASRLNVRAGPSTRYEIVVTLNRNTRVTVFAKSGDWLKIGYPEGEYVYIHPRHLQGEIPADIPETGLIRTVQSEEAPIRVRNWERSSVVGTARKDDLVTLVGMRGQWAKILPPASAYAWVFGKHVEHGGNLTQEGAPTPAEGTEVAAAGGEETGESGEAPKPPEMTEEQRERIRNRYKVIEQQIAAQENERRGEIESILGELDAELAAIQAEIDAKKAQARSAYPANVSPPPPTPDAIGGFTGWVEYIGRAGRRPAAFRLVKGGEILFLMRSATVDLYDFVNRRVIANGRVELAPGFQANVLIVDSIRMLDTGPISVQERPEVRRPYLSPDRPDLPTPPSVTAEEEAAEESGTPGVIYGTVDDGGLGEPEPTDAPVIIVPPTDIEEVEVITPGTGGEVIEETGTIEVEEVIEPVESGEDTLPLEIGMPVEAGTDVVEIVEEGSPAGESTPPPSEGAVVVEPVADGEDLSDLPPPPPLPETIGDEAARLAEEIGEAAEVIETEE